MLGLDCKFLQGDATDFQEVSRFMERLMASGGYSSMHILNYNKDDTLQRVLLNCCPIMDDCGPNNSSRVTHIGAILIESREVHHSAECAELLEEKELEEVGMPLDRREGCRSCTNLNRLHPPTLDHWRALAEGLSLAHILRYMIRSQAPIVLTDRYQRYTKVVSVTFSRETNFPFLILSCMFNF